MTNLFIANKNQDLTISNLENFSSNDRQLMAMNFGVGSKVRVLQKYRDTIIVAKDNMRLALSADIACKIFCH